MHIFGLPLVFLLIFPEFICFGLSLICYKVGLGLNDVLELASDTPLVYKSMLIGKLKISKKKKKKKRKKESKKNPGTSCSKPLC